MLLFKVCPLPWPPQCSLARTTGRGGNNKAWKAIAMLLAATGSYYPLMQFRVPPKGQPYKDLPDHSAGSKWLPPFVSLKITASFQTFRIPSKIDNCNRSAARRKNGKFGWLILSSRISTPCQMINHRVVPVPNQFCTTRRVKSSKEMQPGKKISLHQTPSFLVRWIFHPALLH